MKLLIITVYVPNTGFLPKTSECNSKLSYQNALNG